MKREVFLAVLPLGITGAILLYTPPDLASKNQLNPSSNLHQENVNKQSPSVLSPENNQASPKGSPLGIKGNPNDNNAKNNGGNGNLVGGGLEKSSDSPLIKVKAKPEASKPSHTTHNIATPSPKSKLNNQSGNQHTTPMPSPSLSIPSIQSNGDDSNDNEVEGEGNQTPGQTGIQSNHDD